MYVNLLSLLSSPNNSREDVKHIGLFSYGSGSSATLLHATIHHDRAHHVELPMILESRELVSFDTLSTVVGGVEQEEEGKMTVLERKPGVYYRDVTNEGVARTYVREF